MKRKMLDDEMEGAIAEIGELPVNYDNLHYRKRKVVREMYVRQQEGLCYYCKDPLSGPPSPEASSKKVHRRKFPENFFKNPVHLHHGHATGMTIGAVHCYCNAVLWEHHGE